jgi:hypothetical protein
MPLFTISLRSIALFLPSPYHSIFIFKQNILRENLLRGESRRAGFRRRVFTTVGLHRVCLVLSRKRSAPMLTPPGDTILMSA